MRFGSKTLAVLAISVAPMLWTATAEAACVRKAAVATAPTESQAKWFAMETIVQQISWGLWPGWVATGQLPGYKVQKRKYTCSKADFGVKCNATATICKTG